MADEIRIKCDTNEVSDGYHTFGELYEHRIELFITLARWVSCFGTADVWRSLHHSDLSRIEGWFVMGIFSQKGEQVTYHLPISRWADCDFAEPLATAPAFDGHTPADVINRLKKL